MRQKKPTLPFKQLTIDGETVKVELKPLGRFAQGYAKGGDYAHNHIRLSPHGTRHSRRMAMMHELGHHLWERSGLSTRFSVATEELIVDELMAWVVQALRDNPTLVDFLTAE